MSEYQTPPEILELNEKNKEYELRLEKSEPFWSGMTKGKYPKMKYGYGLKDPIGKEKMFVSETVHELIQISGVGDLELFKIQLKSNADKTVWLLSRDGKDWKSKYQYHDEKVSGGSPKVEEKPNDIVDNSNASAGGDDIPNEIQKIKKEIESLATRIDILSRRVGSVATRVVKPSPVSEEDIPF